MPHVRFPLRIAWCTLLALLALASAGARRPGGARVPAIVFVSRNPVPGVPGAIPGFGPQAHTVVTGGRLLVRESDGRVRELLPRGVMVDVSDPSVSFDARRVAFAGAVHADSAWRIFVVNLDGSGLAAVTHTDRDVDLTPLGSAAKRFERYDDIDPCWIDDDVLCFASTRYPQPAQIGGAPVMNLYEVALARGAARAARTPIARHVPLDAPLARITAERNGAEEPAYDARTGDIVFTRWWTNRWRPTATGITSDSAVALPIAPPSVWQGMRISPSGRGERLACADFGARRREMAYQPTVMADGSIVGVYATHSGLWPDASGTGLQGFGPAMGRSRTLVGADRERAATSGYGDTGGLASPSACAPAALPDGGLVFAYDPGARGDFGLWRCSRDGTALERIVDLPGTLELDPAPVVRRVARGRSELDTAWARLRGVTRVAPLAALSDALPARTRDDLATAEPAHAARAATAESRSASGLRGAFRFECVDAMTNGARAILPAAHVAAESLRVRFFALLARPEVAGGDTAVLVREAALGANGVLRVDGLPEGVPMFEQVVDGRGHVLSNAMAAAHVAGSNVGRADSPVRCVGCHLGHSTLPVPRTR